MSRMGPEWSRFASRAVDAVRVVAHLITITIQQLNNARIPGTSLANSLFGLHPGPAESLAPRNTDALPEIGRAGFAIASLFH